MAILQTSEAALSCKQMEIYVVVELRSQKSIRFPPFGKFTHFGNILYQRFPTLYPTKKKKLPESLIKERFRLLSTLLIHINRCDIADEILIDAIFVES